MNIFLSLPLLVSVFFSQHVLPRCCLIVVTVMVLLSCLCCIISLVFGVRNVCRLYINFRYILMPFNERDMLLLTDTNRSLCDVPGFVNSIQGDHQLCFSTFTFLIVYLLSIHALVLKNRNLGNLKGTEREEVFPVWKFIQQLVSGQFLCKIKLLNILCF